MVVLPWKLLFHIFPNVVVIGFLFYFMVVSALLPSLFAFVVIIVLYFDFFGLPAHRKFYLCPFQYLTILGHTHNDAQMSLTICHAFSCHLYLFCFFILRFLISHILLQLSFTIDRCYCCCFMFAACSCQFHPTAVVVVQSGMCLTTVALLLSLLLFG